MAGEWPADPGFCLRLYQLRGAVPLDEAPESVNWGPGPSSCMEAEQMEGMCGSALCQNPQGGLFGRAQLWCLGLDPMVLAPGSKFSGCPRQERGSSSLSPGPVLLDYRVLL